MKMEFKFKGDVNALMTTLLFGGAFTLTEPDGRTLHVQPKMSAREGMQLNIKHSSPNSEKIITLPVMLPDFGGEAMMSFQYNVGNVTVAESAPTIYEDVTGKLSITESEGCKTAFSGHDPVKVLQFKRGIDAYHSLIIKFE